MALSARLAVTLSANYTNPLDNSTPADAPLYRALVDLANGSGSDQASKLWHDRRSLAATSETLDLAGSLVDAFGATLTFATVKLLAIRNRMTTPSATLIVGGAAANQFVTPFNAGTDKIKVGAGGLLILASPVDGYAVTGGTGDQLKLDSGAATIDYDIFVLGT